MNGQSTPIHGQKVRHPKLGIVVFDYVDDLGRAHVREDVDVTPSRWVCRVEDLSFLESN